MVCFSCKRVNSLVCSSPDAAIAVPDAIAVPAAVDRLKLLSVCAYKTGVKIIWSGLRDYQNYGPPSP